MMYHIKMFAVASNIDQRFKYACASYNQVLQHTYIYTYIYIYIYMYICPYLYKESS